jgi:hypothetical protein
MVDGHQKLNETTAGKEVQKELLATKKKCDEEIKATKKSMKAAIEAENQKRWQINLLQWKRRV